jgi:hypothetical protein
MKGKGKVRSEASVQSAHFIDAASEFGCDKT